MTNAYGVRTADAQARVVDALRAAGFDARPMKRLPGPGVGVAGVLDQGTEAAIERIVKSVQPEAVAWPPASFVR